MSKLLEVRNITKNYHDAPDSRNILQDLSLAVNRGDFLCILGPSGCGKTTLIRCIAGFEGYEGEILVDGKKVEKPGIDRMMVFQDFNQLFPWKTVKKNIQYPLKVNGVTEKAKLEKIAQEHLDLVGLGDKGDLYPHQLSGGMKQRVAIAKGLALNPKIILMDEPSMGLSPLLVSEIFDIIKVISEGGTTVLLVEQNAKKALSIADRAYVLETGNITLSGKASDLMNDDSVKKAYLGE